MLPAAGRQLSCQETWRDARARRRDASSAQQLLAPSSPRRSPDETPHASRVTVEGVTVEGVTATVVAQGRVQQAPPLSDAQLVRGGAVQESVGATLHATVVTTAVGGG